MVFKNCINLTPDDVKEITEALTPELNSLVVSDCHWFGDEILGQISERCNKLSSVTFSGSLPGLTATGISSLVRNCVDLKSLSILSTECNISEAEQTKEDAESDAKDLPEWILDDEIFHAFLDKPCASLEYFSLCGFGRITSEGLKKFIEHEKTTLTALDLSELAAVDSTLLEDIGTLCSNVRTIKFSHCNLTDESLESFCSKCKLLQSIDVSGCEDLTDNAVISVTKHCELLENFNIKCCLKVTERSLDALAANCPKLKSIDISQCAINHIPFEFLNLEALKDLKVDGCESLKCPPLSVASKGFEAIRNFLQQCDVQSRCRLTFLGSQGSGKSSLMLSLPMVHLAVADVPTEGVHVSLWKPFVNAEGEYGACLAVIRHSFASIKALSTLGARGFLREELRSAEERRVEKR